MYAIPSARVNLVTYQRPTEVSARTLQESPYQPENLLPETRVQLSTFFFVNAVARYRTRS
jgi:hypothetical protein